MILAKTDLALAPSLFIPQYTSVDFLNLRPAHTCAQQAKTEMNTGTPIRQSVGPEHCIGTSVSATGSLMFVTRYVDIKGKGCAHLRGTEPNMTDTGWA